MDAFRRSSLAHVLAVSGAHIGYLVLGATYLLNKSKLSRKKANTIVIFTLLLFMSIAGFTPSVVRACIMGIIVQISHLFHKKSDVWTAIAFSLLIVLVQNPLNIHNLGLQLSYLGTIGIILFSRNIEKLLIKTNINKIIIKMIAVTFSAQVLIMPVVIYNFNVFSLTFFISNIVAMPLLGAIIIIGFMNIIVATIWLGLAEFIAIITNLLLECLILTATIGASLPFSNIIITTPSIAGIIAYFAIVGLTWCTARTS